MNIGLDGVNYLTKSREKLRFVGLHKNKLCIYFFTT